MIARQFEEIWASAYALTPPISHFLRDVYPERWFRIHSLPKSRRYPVDESDWRILLDRQNSLISDLLGHNTDILFVTGAYDNHSTDKPGWTFSPTESIRHLSFTELQPISLAYLHKDIEPNDYEPGDLYRPVFSQVTWQPSTWDRLLKEIASDDLRAFFVSITNGLIIAPYDGGVDIILKDEPTRAMYKAKYKNWLSAREDGL